MIQVHDLVIFKKKFIKVNFSSFLANFQFRAGIFPARASPSYEGSEPSRAELGHFDFRAENELDFFLINCKRWQFSNFPAKKKGHEPSRAENTSARAMAQASSARTHH